MLFLTLTEGESFDLCIAKSDLINLAYKHYHKDMQIKLATIVNPEHSKNGQQRVGIDAPREVQAARGNAKSNFRRKTAAINSPLKGIDYETLNIQDPWKRLEYPEVIERYALEHPGEGFANLSDEIQDALICKYALWNFYITKAEYLGEPLIGLAFAYLNNYKNYRKNKKAEEAAAILTELAYGNIDVDLWTTQEELREATAKSKEK